MNEISKVTLQNLLEKQLGEKRLDLVDLVALPASMDRVNRLQALRSIMEQFERTLDSDTASFLIQVKKQKKEVLQEAVQNIADGATVVENHIHERKNAIDGVYQPNGKLNVTYLLQNAELLFESGEYALSKNIFRTLRQSGERSAVALFGIGKCLEAENKADEACTYYEESIAYQPDLETYLRFSNLLLKMGKNTQAAETMERALHIKDLSNTQKLNQHKSAALCWLKAGDRIKARQHLEKALELGPSNDEVNLQMGIMFLEDKEYPHAKRKFQDALAVNTQNWEAFNGLAQCYVAEGDKKAAHDTFAKALNIQLNNPTAIFQLVKLAFELKTYAVAARLLEEYTEIAPINASLLYSLAGLQFHLGRTQDARNTANRILGISPNHTGAKELLGMIDRYLAG